MDDKSEILFLWANRREFHALNVENRGVHVANLYKNYHWSLKALRRLQIILNISPISFWLESWKYDLHKYKTVIVHASKISPPVVRFIRSARPDIRIIVWYWNPVDKSEQVGRFPKEICERWTFDSDDAKKYDLGLNTQYYFDDVAIGKTAINNDVLFVGADKGRLSYLLELERLFNNAGLKTDFHITNTGTLRGQGGYQFRPHISYDGILRKIEDSRAILDIVSDGQSGLTLRPLEALFFGKKLITNNKKISDHPLYHVDNVFILGHDDTDKLGFFLSKPVTPISESVKAYYDFEEWLQRFYKQISR